MDISQPKVDVPCPKCKANISVLIKQVEQQETIICSACNSKINLVDKDGSAKKAVRDINKSFKDLENTIQKIRKVILFLTLVHPNFVLASPFFFI